MPILPYDTGAPIGEQFQIDEIPGESSAIVKADRNREYTRKYRVTGKLPMTEHQAIERLIQAVNIGDPHPQNAWMFANAIGPLAPESNDRRTWAGEVKFGAWEANEESPLDDPIQVDWDRIGYEEICDRDVAGEAITNSAGDPYDPPVLRDRTRCILTVVRNEATYNAAIADAYSDKINAEEFFDCDPGTWKCEGITARNAFKQGFGYYFVVTYKFAFRAEGWNARPLDQGLRKKVGTSREAIIVSGHPTQTPVLLNGAGLPLAVGGEAVFGDHQVYHAVDFVVALGFGESTV